MDVLLDSNVWRYVVDQNSEDEIERVATENGIEIVVAPELVFEAQALRDEATRKKCWHPRSNRFIPCNS